MILLTTGEEPCPTTTGALGLLAYPGTERGNIRRSNSLEGEPEKTLSILIPRGLVGSTVGESTTSVSSFPIVAMTTMHGVFCLIFPGVAPKE